MGLFGGGKVLTGLDIGASAVKLVKGTLKKSSFDVERLVIVPLPNGAIDDRGIVRVDDVTAAVTAAIAELGAKAGTPLAISLRGGSVVTKRVVIPKVKKGELEETIKWEAEQVFPQDMASTLVEHVVVGEIKNLPDAPPGTPGVEVLLIGVNEEIVGNLHDMITNSGGACKLIDLDGFVCASFLSTAMGMAKTETVGFIDVGASATRTTVMTNGTVTFLREFPIGGNSFTDSISMSLGLSFENAEALKIQDEGGIPADAVEAIRSQLVTWKNELQQCEDLYVTQNATGPVTRWILFGGAAKTPGLYQSLQDARFGERIEPFKAEEFFRAKGRAVDPALLAAWSMRLVSSAGLSTKKG